MHCFNQLQHALAPLRKPSAAALAWPLTVTACVLLAHTVTWAQQATGSTDIAQEPLISMAESQAKPNLMILLDDSISMNYDYMPDTANYTNTRIGNYTAQCNGVYYNPHLVYEPPLYADGSSYPDAVFEAVLPDGFASLNASIRPTSGAGFISNRAINLVSSDSQTVPLRFLTTTRAALGIQIFDVQSASTQAIGHASFPAGTNIVLSGAGARNMTGIVTEWTYNPNTDRGILKVDVQSVGGATLAASNAWNAVIAGQFYFQYRGTEPALSYAYNNNGSLVTNTFRTQCNQLMTGARTTSINTNVFESVPITSTSAAELKTNYANWYSYYRTRELLMRTAMGKAINQLDETYRVGFMTINRTDMSLDRLEFNNSSERNVTQNFRNIEDFTPQKKADVYESLYRNNTSGTTALRNALARAGQYYANKATRQGYDPIQYACQRNYVLMTTDGYWNSTAGMTLTGGAIGNADGNAPRPMGGNTSSNTLADVAYYYYSTDLRAPSMNNCVSGSSGFNVCENIVPPNGRDDATHQHMTTFAIGLGVSGTLPYSKTYLTDTTGTYADIVSGSLNWPTPSANNITTIDDLWHAAVNGRGIYYSAQNPADLAAAIEGVVASMQQTSGTASGTSTSTLDLVQGENNYAFEASYTTVQWTGDVEARLLNPNTGEQDKESPPLWSARTQLDRKLPAQRRVFFNRAGALMDFQFANLPDGQKSLFSNRCISTPATRLSQCSSLNAEAQAQINQGESLVSFLRGDRSLETSNQAKPLFRLRESVLGDIVNSKPIHVGTPPFIYQDAGYADFKSSQANRKRMVYVGANDGMLHALDAQTGEELWAYVPTAVMPNLYKLADTRYGSVNRPHQYFVDGKTVQGDVLINNQWRTILVGGLNAGGRAYYALDITDPVNPRLLWEFSNTNLGLSFGDPIITKIANGTWVVAFGSGYNNLNPGDNRGRLFVVNAATGALVRNIATNAGSLSQPAGLAQVNVWRTSSIDNTAERFYAGDLLGNIWRFDVDGKYQPFNSALQLAQMQDASGSPQPITTEIKLRGLVSPTLVVATGRFLGSTDIGDHQTQSIAVLKDPLTNASWGVLRKNADFQQQVIRSDTSGQTSSTSAENNLLNNKQGWWADFPGVGERVNIPMVWAGNALVAATATPEGDVCKAGGSSWLYRISLETGAIKGTQYSDATMIVGLSVMYKSDTSPFVLGRDGDGTSFLMPDFPPLQGESTAGDIKARRLGWRELH